MEDVVGAPDVPVCAPIIKAGTQSGLVHPAMSDAETTLFDSRAELLTRIVAVNLAAFSTRQPPL